VGYRSGPGRLWLFFVLGAGTFSFLLLVGLGRQDPALVQALRLVGVLSFGLVGWRAHRLGVEADADGVTVRRWPETVRYRWDDINDVVIRPVRPELVLRDTSRVPLLDNWHHDPASVAAEVRTRWEAARSA